MNARLSNGQREADYYDRQPDGSVLCRLCPRGCRIMPGARGWCLGRVNYGGTLIAETYNRPASVALDPIEKKPLYHVAPGSQILSVGTFGCNLACRFCQNCELSQQRTPTESITLADMLLAARSRQSVGIAFTYNEPTVWFECVRDTALAFREAGLLTVLVTNGYINLEPLAELLPLIDAMNIDLKAFREGFYRDICQGHLEPVKNTIRAAAKAVHVEITNLIIPGQNDAAGEQEEMAAWIAAEVGPATPVHLSAYFPRHRMHARPATAEDLRQAKARFDKVLKHVYLGNIAVPGGSDTRCPSCDHVAVVRTGYAVDRSGMTAEGRCAACGAELGMLLPRTAGQ